MCAHGCPLISSGRHKYLSVACLHPRDAHGPTWDTHGYRMEYPWVPTRRPRVSPVPPNCRSPPPWTTPQANYKRTRRHSKSTQGDAPLTITPENPNTIATAPQTYRQTPKGGVGKPQAGAQDNANDFQGAQKNVVAVPKTLQAMRRGPHGYSRGPRRT